MKTLLIGINAKFIHSNLAIRYLKKYADTKINMQEIEIQLCEFTINQQLDLILREILKHNADIIGFSCYIWNYELIKKLVIELKKLIPNTTIFLGGPEVSFDSQAVISQTGCDAVISGEGEAPFAELIQKIYNNAPYSDIAGITTHNEVNSFVQNTIDKPIALNDIPFIYEDYTDLENRIIYYEASRGCPFNCQYCLSGSLGGVRFLSLERVFSDLLQFLSKNVPQVKFVDRTFNCNKQYSMSIWQFLSEHDNGITNFHFEIAAELLDEDVIVFLNTVRKGLFQFEIGVQSTNSDTLKSIKRSDDIERLSDTVKRLQKGNNIHLHLDLIAGLPFEDYESFKQSFNHVYSLSPDQFQLGFLKLLKGSGLYDKSDVYGLVHTSYAPYEVLKTNWLTYDDILKLKMIEEMVETYYNSSRYVFTVKFLSSFFTSPFDMYEALAYFYESNGLHLRPHSKVDYYTILYKFLLTLNISSEEHDRFKWYALYDCYSHEKAKKLPEWLDVSLTSKYKNDIYNFINDRENVSEYLSEYQEFDTKQILRNAHIEIFPFNPFYNSISDYAVIFNYRKCDLLGNVNITVLSVDNLL